MMLALSVMSRAGCCRCEGGWTESEKPSPLQPKSEDLQVSRPRAPSPARAAPPAPRPAVRPPSASLTPSLACSPCPALPSPARAPRAPPRTSSRAHAGRAIHSPPARKELLLLRWRARCRREVGVARAYACRCSDRGRDDNALVARAGGADGRGGRRGRGFGWACATFEAGRWDGRGLRRWPHEVVLFARAGRNQRGQADVHARKTCSACQSPSEAACDESLYAGGRVLVCILLRWHHRCSCRISPLQQPGRQARQTIATPPPSPHVRRARRRNEPAAQATSGMEQGSTGGASGRLPEQQTMTCRDRACCGPLGPSPSFRQPASDPKCCCAQFCSSHSQLVHSQPQLSPTCPPRA